MKIFVEEPRFACFIIIILNIYGAFFCTCLFKKFCGVCVHVFLNISRRSVKKIFCVSDGIERLAFFASKSTVSLSLMPVCAGTQTNLILAPSVFNPGRDCSNKLARQSVDSTVSFSVERPLKTT